MTFRCSASVKPEAASMIRPLKNYIIPHCCVSSLREHLLNRYRLHIYTELRTFLDVSLALYVDTWLRP